MAAFYSDFSSLWRRFLAREPDAGTTILRECTPTLLRGIQQDLNRRQLRCLVDPEDILQCAWMTLLEVSARQPLHFSDRAELIGYLGSIAEHAVFKFLESQLAARRDLRRTTALPDELPDGSPADATREAVFARDVVHQLEVRLSFHDRQLLRLRDNGRTWTELAKDRDTTPDALRVRFQRLMARARTLLSDLDPDIVPESAALAPPPGMKNQSRASEFEMISVHG